MLQANAPGERLLKNRQVQVKAPSTLSSQEKEERTPGVS